MALGLGVAALFLAASFWGVVLERPGPYRALPWAHLAGHVVVLAAAVAVARRVRSSRKARHFVAWVGAGVAVVSALVLWGFVFVGARLPAHPVPALARAPDFVLADQEGRMVRLADLRVRGPVLVVFFRGAFDGWARASLSDLGRVAGAGGQVVAVTGEGRGELAALGGKLGLHYPLLSDPNLATARAFGILDEDTHTPHPSYVVVRPDGSIAWIHLLRSLRALPSPEELLQRLGALPNQGAERQVRPWIQRQEEALK